MSKKFENSIKHVLAFESSCDDTSVAIVSGTGQVKSLVSAAQDLEHRDFGGVVPEIASRSHTHNLLPLVERAFEKSGMTQKEIDGIAVTSRPGLVGSLMVAVTTAKTLSWLWGKPLIDVNHLEAHLLAPFLKDEKFKAHPKFCFPYLALAISGGHTHLYQVNGLGDYEVLGQTLDDAAGEAFDKFAKMLDLPFPGGVEVDRLAKKGNPQAYSFPKPLNQKNNLNFSFSGLKTAARNLLAQQNQSGRKSEMNKPDLCASYQETIVDILMKKLEIAWRMSGLDCVVLTGGVSANSRLRARAMEWGKKQGVLVVIPPVYYCTDNGAMVGYVGVQKLCQGEMSDLSLQASSRHLEGDFKKRPKALKSTTKDYV